jgi:hypothetical protein
MKAERNQGRVGGLWVENASGQMGEEGSGLGQVTHLARPRVRVTLGLDACGEGKLFDWIHDMLIVRGQVPRQLSDDLRDALAHGLIHLVRSRWN